MQPTAYKVTDNHDGTITIKDRAVGEITWKLTVVQDALCVQGFYTSKFSNEIIAEDVLVYPVDRRTIKISLY